MLKENSYTLLSPIKEQDLRISFGHCTDVQNILDPEVLFSTTIDQFKKLAIGNYFWFIADATKWLTVSCGGDTQKMFGIEASTLSNQSPQVLFSRTHPDDLEKMFSFTNYWVNYFMQLPNERKAHNRATIYLRMLDVNNKYNWMMVQYCDQILDEYGKILYGLTLITNIQHLKTNGIASMSILDTYNENCQQFICVDGKSLLNSTTPEIKITNREIEVLRLLVIGKSSKQIAAILGIAQKTIDNHRQNMLHKTNCSTTGELISFGIKNGYL